MALGASRRLVHLNVKEKKTNKQKYDVYERTEKRVSLFLTNLVSHGEILFLTKLALFGAIYFIYLTSSGLAQLLSDFVQLRFVNNNKTHFATFNSRFDNDE